MKVLQKILFGFAISMNVISHAQTSNEYVLHSVENAISKALETNPNLEVYKLQQEIANKNYKIAKAYRLLSVTGTATGQRNISLATTPLPGEIFGQPGQTINAEFGQEYQYNAGLNINKNLFDWQLNLNKKIAKSNIDLADLDTKAFQQNLIEQTSLYYYSALVTQEAIKINEKNLKIADSISELTKHKFNQGLLDKITLNSSKININKIKQTKVSNLQQLNIYLKELHILLGLKDDQIIVLEESLESTPQQLFGTSELNSDAVLAMYELQKEQSSLNLKYQKASLYPKLSMYSYVGKQYFSNDFGFNNSVWNDYQYVGLNVSVPIFSGFSNKNKIKKAKIEYTIATQNYTSELKKSKLNDEVLIKNYQAGFESLDVSIENYQLHKENTALIYQKYTEGLIRLEDYLMAFEDYLKAQNNYLNTLSNTYSYHATILSRQ